VTYDEIALLLGATLHSKTILTVLVHRGQAKKKSDTTTNINQREGSSTTVPSTLFPSNVKSSTVPTDPPTLVSYDPTLSIRLTTNTRQTAQVTAALATLRQTTSTAVPTTTSTSTSSSASPVGSILTGSLSGVSSARSKRERRGGMEHGLLGLSAWMVIF
jgi:hypothetical protein